MTFVPTAGKDINTTILLNYSYLYPNSTSPPFGMTYHFCNQSLKFNKFLTIMLFPMGFFFSISTIMTIAYLLK